MPRLLWEGSTMKFKHDPLLACEHPECVCRLNENYMEFVKQIEERVRSATVWARVAISIASLVGVLGTLWATL